MPPFILYIVTKWRLYQEERRIRSLYYSDLCFKEIDQTLLKAYRRLNPYKVSRQFLQKKGEKEIYCYGETPLTTYEKIGKEANLKSTDRLLEFGSGRGRGVFFLSSRFGAFVKGVEWIPLFVAKARKVAEERQVKNAVFSCEDYAQTDLKGFSVLYLYGTCLSDEEIKALCARFRTLPKETRIITVSYPLTEYDPSFIVKKEFPLTFPWGETTGYIQSVR